MARAERETREMLKIGISDFGRKRRILLAIYAANITFQLLTGFSCQKKNTISNCFLISYILQWKKKKGEGKKTYISIMKNIRPMENTAAWQFNKIFTNVNTLQPSPQTCNSMKICINVLKICRKVLQSIIGYLGIGKIRLAILIVATP